MTRRWVALAGLLAATGLGMGFLEAQTPGRMAAARAHLSAEVGDSLAVYAGQAERRGLPTDPLVDKALEGAAKRVPGPQIVQALRGLVEDLGRAQELLQGSAVTQAKHLEAVAVAIRRGAAPDAVRRLALGATPEEPFGVTVNTFADLTARGVDARSAAALLATWRGRGANPEALSQLPAAIDRLLRDGVLPAQAASAVDAALRSGRPLGVGLPPVAGPPRGRPPEG